MWHVVFIEVPIDSGKFIWNPKSCPNFTLMGVFFALGGYEALYIPACQVLRSITHLTKMWTTFT